MQRVTIRLDISRDRILSHYRGVARHVVTIASDGRTIQFPATMLRQFVSEEGVRGIFEIVFDDQNRLHSMRRLQPGAELDKMA